MQYGFSSLVLGAGATTAITTSAGAGMVVELTLGVGFFFVGADFAADFAAGFAEPPFAAVDFPRALPRSLRRESF